MPPSASRYGNVTVYVGWPLEPGLRLSAGNFQDTIRALVRQCHIDRIVVAVGATSQPEIAFTSAWAEEQLRPLGYEAERESVSIEGIDIRALKWVALLGENPIR